MANKDSNTVEMVAAPKKINNTEAVQVLINYNKWCRGGSNKPMPDPVEVTQAIERAIKVMAQLGWTID